MKRILILAIAAIFCATVQAQEKTVTNQVKQEVVVDDYRIIKDEVVDGVRYVVAAPSATVCSKQIDIQIKDGIIQSVVYTRGCDGNAKGIGALIKGMSVRGNQKARGHHLRQKTDIMSRSACQGPEKLELTEKEAVRLPFLFYLFCIAAL